MSVTSIIPRSTTWDVLQNSRNQAAIATLASGLKSEVPELRHLCLKSLLAKAEDAARYAIILNWENYDETDRRLLRTRPARFAETAKLLLTTGTLAERRMALAAVSDLDLNDSIDVVLKIAVDRTNALGLQATECLTKMCERWGNKARNGKDVPTIRGRMLERLSAQLAVFHEHKNAKLVDAWLCLAHWDDSLQRSLIADSRHGAYRTLMQRLRESQHPSVIQLLGGYLVRTATPANVLAILTERTEPSVAVEIAKRLETHTIHGAVKRLQQLAPLQCLKHIEDELKPVNVEIERRLWLMVSASTDDLGQVLRGALKLSKLGTKEARQTAADMLRNCKHPDLDQLVAAIQTATSDIAENDHCVGSLTKQISQWLNSPSMVLRKAAQYFLQDFTVDNLLDQIRHWPTPMCQAMAQIVVLVEPDVTERLTHELQSPAPRRRLAALQATQLLSCVDQVSKALMLLLEDPRLDVRVRTIDLLGALGHESLEHLIPRLLADASTDIQDAAGRAVRRLNRRKKQVPAKG